MNSQLSSKTTTVERLESVKKRNNLFKCFERKPMPSKHQRQSQPASRLRTMMKWGLKYKLGSWVLLPLLFGISVTVGISFMFIFLSQPAWIEITGREVIDTEQKSMDTINVSIADYVKEYFQRVTNDLLFFHDYAYEVRSKKLIYQTYSEVMTGIIFNSETTHAINYYKMIKENLNLPQCPFKNETSYYCSLWYINDTSTKFKDSANNLNIAFNMDVAIRPVFLNAERLRLSKNAGRYWNIYHIFADDGTVYQYPLMKKENPGGILNRTKLTNTTCLNERGPNDSRCSSIFRYAEDFAANPDLKKEVVFFSKPQLYQESNGSSVFSVSGCALIRNKTNPEKLLQIICIDFGLNDLDYYLKASSALKLGYLIVLKANTTQGFENEIGDVIYHSNELKLLETFDKPFVNVSELEFGVQAEYSQRTKNEIQVFENLIKKANIDFKTKNSSTNGLFQKKGQDFMISLNNIEVLSTSTISNNALNITDTSGQNIFTMVMIVPCYEILKPFNDIKGEIYNRIKLQFAFMGGLIILIMLLALWIINKIADSLVSPLDVIYDINVLVKKVTKMEEGDNEVDLSENFKERSEEINMLYKTFSRLINVLRYANEHFFKGNDAEALMNYAVALKLFTDLNNKKAMAIIYNNIGNIHMQNERYEEGILNYKLAVDITDEEYQKSNKLSKEKMKNNNRGTFRNTYRNSKYSYRNSNRISAKPGTDFDGKRSTGATSSLENKKILERDIANRQYQLANALIIEAEKKGKNNWGDISKNLSKVLRFDIEHKENLSRIVKSHISMSSASLELMDLKKSFRHIKYAEEKLREYAVAYLTDSEDIPPEILKQKINLQKGLFLQKAGKIKEACLRFTECLEVGKIYDPDIRRKSLEKLKEIFESKNLISRAPNILKLLESTRKKKFMDIVFLLDFSGSMSQSARKAYAIKCILTVYDKYIRNEDRIGFIRFNINCDVVFGLMEKGKNHVHLRKNIQNSDKEYPSGETALYTALNIGLKLFKKAEPKDHNRWLVALTDGEDNRSRIDFEKISSKLQVSGINLIIIGLGLHREIIPKLKDLCRSTQEGVFIESPLSTDLEIAFQSMTDVIYGGCNEFFVESWN